MTDGGCGTQSVSGQGLTHGHRDTNVPASGASAPGGQWRGGEGAFTALLETMAEGVVVVTSDGLVVEANHVAERILGLPQTTMVGQHFNSYEWELLRPDGTPMPPDEMVGVRAMRERRAIKDVVACVRRPDWTLTWVKVSATPLVNDAGVVEGVVVAFADTTDWRQAEDDLQRVSRASRALSACNRAMVRATEEAVLLQEICDTIVDVGGYRLAWVGFAERDESRTVRPIAQAGYDDNYLATVKITWADTETGRGPTGTAIRTGQPSIVNDIFTEPGYEPWREEAGKRGYASSAALPLSDTEGVFAALNVYAAEPDAFDAAEMELLCELADDLAYGIQALRTQAAHRQAEAALSHYVGQLEMLHEIDQAILRAQSLPELKQNALDHLKNLTGCDQGYLVLCDWEHREVCLAAATPREGSGFAVGTTWLLGDFAPAASLQPATVEADSARPVSGADSVVAKHMRRDGMRDVVYIPFAAQGGVCGELYLGASERGALGATERELAGKVVDQLTIAVQQTRLREDLETSYLETVLALAKAVDVRDAYTADHSARLAELAVATARELETWTGDSEHLRWAGLLHDIGKLGVTDEILRKPGPLNDDEWRVMQQHPAVGAAIVAPVKQLADVAPLIRSHQERWDGTGYPDGLAGEQIPLGARILAVVDAYSAMIDERPYKQVCSPEEAIAELQRWAGNQFDPQVVEAFLTVLAHQ